MPLQQVSVPYRVNVSDWSDTLLTTLPVEVFCCLLFDACSDFSVFSRCLSALVLTIITTPVSLKKTKNRIYS